MTAESEFHRSDLMGQLRKVQHIPKLSSCLNSLCGPGRACSGPAVGPQPHRTPAIPSPGQPPADRLAMASPLGVLWPLPPKLPGSPLCSLPSSPCRAAEQPILFAHQGLLSRGPGAPASLRARSLLCSGRGGSSQLFPGDHFPGLSPSTPLFQLAGACFPKNVWFLSAPWGRVTQVKFPRKQPGPRCSLLFLRSVPSGPVSPGYSSVSAA